MRKLWQYNKNMKTYITISAIALGAIMTASAQSGSVETSVKVSPPLMDMKAKQGEVRKEMHGDRAQIKEERKNLHNERMGMHASNTEERKDLKADTKLRMKNATSSEERHTIMGDAKDKRDGMKASSTEERKELNERSRDLAKSRASLTVQRLSAADERLQSTLVRLNTAIDNYNASTTNTVKISKASPVLAKAIASGVTSHAASVSVSVYASTTIDGTNKEAFKLSVSAAEKALKTFQMDLKAATKDLIATYDLKANKKL